MTIRPKWMAALLPLAGLFSLGVAPPTLCQDPVVASALKLTDAKQFDRAQKVIAPLFAKPATAGCAADAAILIENQRMAAAPQESVLAAALTQFGKSVRSIAVWLALLIPLAVLLVMLGGVARLISLARRRGKSKVRWRVRSIAAGSDPTILSAWRQAVDGAQLRDTISSNLLIQSGVPLPRSAVGGGTVSVEGDAIIDSAPSIGGFSPSWIYRLLRHLMRQCTSPRRTLALAVTSHEKSAIMRVEATGSDAKTRSASAGAAWTSDADVAEEIEKMAAALALKTNYLIADDTDGIGFPANMRLHEGIEELRAFSERSDIGSLREAAQSFSEARRLTQDGRAALFEGIARELLEEHDVARDIFLKLGQAEPANSSIQLQARYNLAVTYLRRYTRIDVDEADTILAAISAAIEGIKDEDRSAEQGVMLAFAKAGRANAIAHRFIFLEQYPAPAPDEWEKEANRLIEEAVAARTRPEFAGDGAAGTQLEWLIANATGNLALNIANDAENRKVGTTDGNRTRREQALRAFRACEVLVTPGVETLTNIATTLLMLHRPTEALAYTTRARALNPLYEYAYFREFEIEKARAERGAALAVLNDAKRELGVIKIPEFRAAFEAAGIWYYDQ